MATVFLLNGKNEPQNDSMLWVCLGGSRTLYMDQSILCLLVTLVDPAVDGRPTLSSDYGCSGYPWQEEFLKKPDIWAQEIVRTCYLQEDPGKTGVRKNVVPATVLRGKVFKEMIKAK